MNIIYAMYQVPPTPTPLPPASPAPVNLSTAGYHVWNFTDESIMIWNTAPNSATQVLQIAVIVAIIIGVVFLFMTWLKSVSDESE